MKCIETNDRSKFYISDLFDRSDWESCKVTIEESMFGDIPEIRLEMHCKKPICTNNEEFTGWLMDKNGNKELFNCFVLDFTFNNKISNITLLCCKPKFTKDNVVTKYSTIDNAIQSTWQLNILKLPKDFQSDIMQLDSDHYYYQKNITNYNLCSRLCKCYKKDVLFGYGINGLTLMDLQQWKPINQGNPFIDMKDINLNGNNDYVDPKLYQMNNSFVDYSKGKDPNHQLVLYYQQLIPVDNAYKDVIGNMLYNQRYDTSMRLANFRMNYYQKIRIGDGLEIQSPLNKYPEARVTKRVINIDDNAIKVDYTIQCYKKNW